MTNPSQSFRRQKQYFKRSGAGSALMYDGAYTSELFAKANVVVGTDGAVISAVAGSKIRVISYSVSGAAGGVATITFNTKSGGPGVAISQLISLPINGFASETCEAGLFETNAGEGLTATVATSTVGVRITYILVD